MWRAGCGGESLLLPSRRQTLRQLSNRRKRDAPATPPPPSKHLNFQVPPFADLPPIQGACLVKAAPPADLDASGENLFAALVPDASAKALSKYTDAVDAAVREALDKLAGATDAARVALRQVCGWRAAGMALMAGRQQRGRAAIESSGGDSQTPSKIKHTNHQTTFKQQHSNNNIQT